MTTGVRGDNFGPGRLQRSVAGTQGIQFTMAAGVSSLKSNPEVAEGAKRAVSRQHCIRHYADELTGARGRRPIGRFAGQ